MEDEAGEDGEKEDEADQNTENFPASSRFPRCLGAEPARAA